MRLNALPAGVTLKKLTAGPQSALTKRISLNTFWLFAGRVGVQGSLILLTIIIARRMGEVGLGQYAFIASTVYLANILTTFGTDILVIREVAAERDLSSLLGALLLQLGFSSGIVAIVFFGAPLLPNQSGEAVAALRLFSLSLIPTAFYVVFSAALRGYERMAVFTGLNLIVAAFQVTAVWLFIQPGSSIVSLAALLLAAQILSAALAVSLSFIYLPELKKLRATSRKSLAPLLRASAPIAAFAILGVLYQRMSVYLVSTLGGAAATGLLSAAMRVVEAPKVAHVALLGALFPAMSQVHAPQPGGESKTPRFESVFSLSAAGLLAIATLAAAALFFLAEPIVFVLYGGGFAQAVAILKILCWALIPFTVSQYIAISFLSQGMEKQVVLALLSSIAVLFFLTIWALPRWGIIGAAWAVLIAESTQAGVFLLFRKRQST